MQHTNDIDLTLGFKCYFPHNLNLTAEQVQMTAAIQGSNFITPRLRVAEFHSKSIIIQLSSFPIVCPNNNQVLLSKFNSNTYKV